MNIEYNFSIILLAWLIICMDLFLFLRNKDNPLLLLINMFILYFNYSICMGEYIAHNLVIENNDLYSKAFGNLYQKGIILLFLFDLVRFMYMKKKISYGGIKRNPNNFVYYILMICIIYIGIFQIDRSVSVSYEVKISTLYEYSYLFFILLLYYQDESKFKKILTHTIAFIFIMQDMIFGGRITSIQIILTFAIMEYANLLKIKYMVAPFFLFQLLFMAVGVYRAGYSFDSSISGLFDIASGNLFVLDTSVYAYFSSIGHLNATSFVDLGLRFSSLVSFLVSLVLGGSMSNSFRIDSSLSAVTEIASDYHWNAGGGIIFSYFYFWLGYTGVVLLSIITFRILIKILTSKSLISGLISVCLTVAVARWYLYNPTAFYRGPFVIFPILFFVFNKIDSFIKGEETVNADSDYVSEELISNCKEN